MGSSSFILSIDEGLEECVNPTRASFLGIISDLL